MKPRFLLRKNSGDPTFPWKFLDTNCPAHERHDFSGAMTFSDDCNGNCDAFKSFEAALDPVGGRQ